MQTFISEAHCLALQPQEIGVAIDEEDITLVLTGGLPPSYDNFIITLDSTPPADLTLDYVITRLLNEEARQSSTKIVTPSNDVAFATFSKPRDLSEITCFNCRKKGHFQSVCPELKKVARPKIIAATAIAEEEDEAW
jgi:hypothetical protein